MGKAAAVHKSHKKDTADMFFFNWSLLVVDSFVDGNRLKKNLKTFHNRVGFETDDSKIDNWKN